MMLPNSAQEDDTFVWTVEGQPCGEFSASKTWEALRPKESEKEWADLVWFKGSTPKQAFHMWLANLDRLPTRSRLASWGMNIPITCCLCGVSEETRDHLFLHCQFSQVLWKAVLQKLKLPQTLFTDWRALLAWSKDFNPSSPKTLRILVVHAVVYNVWRQRNNIYHNQVSIPPLTIFRDIDRLIRNSITARRNLKSFRNLMALWLS
ncbi:uncharacterized protein LOC111831937 [Capsella rubella]|uniref:uncharacterized protein LOC111831937 n=1 Tax=Capsella rubella TaxID=81985 RepID=UPI000CD5AA06|nr:uncharacterized protein LOC111831937 [Capsella rubella]